MLNVFFERNKRILQRFCDDTSMHGFKELFYAKSFFWLSLWTILVGGAVAVTSYQIYGSIQQFLDQPTITLIQPATKEDMIYPSLKICYPHWLYWIDWQKAYDMNFTRESILFGMSYLTDIYSSKRFNVTEAKNAFILNMKLNKLNTIREFYRSISFKPNTLLLLYYNESYISTLFDSDNIHGINFCHIIQGETIGLMIEREIPEGRTPTRKTSKTNSLSFHILTKPISVDGANVNEEEYAKYIESVLPNIDMFGSVQFTDYGKVFLPVMVYPNTFDKDGGVTVSYQFDAVTISVKTSIHTWKSTQQMPCKTDWKWITMNDTCTDYCVAKYWQSQQMKDVYLSEAILQDNDTFTDNIRHYEFYFMVEKEHNEISVQKIPPVKKFPTSSTATTRKWLSSMTHSKKTESTTTTQDVSKLWARDVQKLLNCSNDCAAVTGCKVYTFDINAQTLQLSHSMGGETSDMSYTPVKIEYPTENEMLVMIEQDAQTWEGFVGNVGGLLGIWTGASILSFVQLFYLCCCTECDGLTVFKFPENRISVTSVNILVEHQTEQIETQN